MNSEVVLTPKQIRALVAAARTNGHSLDTLLTRTLFGARGPPEHERDWPESAQAAYWCAVRQYMNETRIEPKRKGRKLVRCARPPSAVDCWDAVLAVAPNPREWWLLPHTTWWQVARIVGTSSRVASYHFGRLGWVFAGKRSRRRVLSAPCLACTGACAQRRVDVRDLGYCDDCIARNGRAAGHSPMRQ